MQSDIEPLKDRLKAAATVLLAQSMLTDRSQGITPEQLRRLAELLTEASHSIA